MSMKLKMVNKKSSISSSMLGPGFRFHPTDEELVRYYLRRKVCGKAIRFDAISEIDIYKAEPWDLPCMSKLKTRDLEWYFFSELDKKYGNGARTNRATEKGYWKTTGRDRAVYHKTQIVGMKKTLVYHSGRPPKGQRTNWVMHEYRLTDLELENAGVVQDAFVLCRVFQKSGSGPKNGEQYGAPFVEEEWEDDDLELVTEDEATGEVDFGGDAWFNSHNLQKALGSDVPLDTAPFPSNFQCADGNYIEETTDSFNDMRRLLVHADQQNSDPEQCDDKNISNSPASYDMVVKPVEEEHNGECSKSVTSKDIDYVVDESFLDSLDNFQYCDEGFLEANDLSNPIETNASAIDMLEEYLALSNANDDSSLFFACDSAMAPGSEDLVSDQALIPQKELRKGTLQATSPSGLLIDNNNKDAASMSAKQESAKYQSDIQYPYIKKASQMLGNIPAPPAFAAEFPSKDVTAGMIQIRNSSTGGNGTDRSSNKHENFNIVLLFGFSLGNDGSSSLESSVSILQGKSLSTVFRGWFYFILLWVLVLSMSFKVGTYVLQSSI
ncbi:hypothetical protein CDL12_22923 [Handroanthus impetiginosus]|uniref:NAC domain-containing protein n=1 Tax=Handroanthus impetiginosus TaxID=429701 RepID=A0A2G9GGX9_9LAMI|nr:hypothetical protein CDL12_22923 [Handroanthus impetiginosus]